jgi:hypothetical protein
LRFFVVLLRDLEDHGSFVGNTSPKQESKRFSPAISLPSYSFSCLRKSADTRSVGTGGWLNCLRCCFGSSGEAALPQPPAEQPNQAVEHLLKPLAPEDVGKKTLVLDLDETLVHSSFKVRSCSCFLFFSCVHFTFFHLSAFFVACVRLDALAQQKFSAVAW